MASDERAAQIGELIRQLRRQQNITQTELGATRYSKSYVSAVEKNTIRASPEALLFFAEQLGQPGDYFISQLNPLEDRKQVDILQEAPATNGGQYLHLEKERHVLGQMLERVGIPDVRAAKALPPLAPEMIATLRPSEQANYFLFAGIVAQEKQEYEAALHSFERALPFASAQMQPVVLDALGENHFLTRSYATALYYHQRALTTLRTYAQEPQSTLLFPIALHCGEDYRILGAYTQACAMYESARTHLRAVHEMKSAAQLYHGWGYCTYGLAYQAAQLPSARERGSLEKVEQEFQRAIEFIVQSRGLSQASGDRLGEITARLLLAKMELDFSTARRQLSEPSGGAFPASCLTLLDDVEEQCHQILVSSQDMLKHRVAIIYEAVAYLVRSLSQRADLARLSGQVDTAMQQRALALNLCQKAFDALGESSFPVTLLQAALSAHSDGTKEDAPALPRLPELIEDAPASRAYLPGLADFYRAAGEMTEELGRSASSQADARDCYAYADRCFDRALAHAHIVVSMQERDPGYLLRFRQRYARLVEERAIVAPEMGKETSRALAALLGNGLFEFQNTIISAQLPAPDVAQK